MSFEQLASLDIPTFKAIVRNEFANIDNSFKNLKEKGIVDAYTRNETQSKIDSDFMKSLAQAAT